jgi:hypothetical protein
VAEKLQRARDFYGDGKYISQNPTEPFSLGKFSSHILKFGQFHLKALIKLSWKISVNISSL